MSTIDDTDETTTSPASAVVDDFEEFYEAVTVHTDDERYSQDFIRLPGLMATYGRRLAHATRELLRAKREYEHTAARLYGAKRRELEDDPAVEGRVTEGRIDAAVRADAEWLDARAKYDDASAAKADAQARFDALKSKETALQNLAATYRAEVKLSSH